jgi:hypothetical protein
MGGEEELSKQFKALYDEWGAAIANHQYEWFERHFAQDFLGTAQPWPTLSVNKQQMIDLDRSITTMDVEWLNVKAQRFGDVVLTSGIVKYNKEEFKQGAIIAEGMPTGDQLSALSNGKKVLYINGWRHNGIHWQIFDHHMVGVVESGQ